MATGNKTAAKMINTSSLNGKTRGANLLLEFKAYVGEGFAEEAFEASQPGELVVRRDQEANMGKLRCSNHWVSSCHVSYPCTDSFFVGRYRGFADTCHGKYGLHYDAVLRCR